MDEENYLLSYLRKANEKPNNDHHLSFGMEGEMRFFRSEEMADNWGARLDYFEKIDRSISPIFEAVYLFGKWKKDKDYQSALASISKFKEMELIAYERKWFWVLVLCIKEQKNLCFKLGKDEDLKAISERIIKYLTEGKEVFPTHTFVELINQFTRLLEKVDKESTEKVYDLTMKYLENGSLNYSFKERLLNEGIIIKKSQKEDKIVRELHRKILNSILKEAEERGKDSKLILSGFLEDALDYCVKYVGDKELTRTIKRRLSEIDYTDELKTIELPDEEKKKLQEAYKKYEAVLKKSINDYVDKLKPHHPLGILYNLSNDESLIRMKVYDVKDFADKLMREHPIQSIFSLRLDFGDRRKKIDSSDERREHKLHELLQPYLNEAIWVVTNILRQLIEQNIVVVNDFYHFLKRCSCINQSDLDIIMNGIVKHFDEDYLSSTSILIPKIESAMYNYLTFVGADVTSYDREILGKRMLGGLIDQHEIEKNFSIDFQYFMKLFLVADDSINYRNRFAHGTLHIQFFNDTMSLIVIFLLLKIYSKSFQIPERVKKA